MLFFLAGVQLANLPTPTPCKEFCHMAITPTDNLLNNMQITETEPDRRWRLIRPHLPVISASTQVE